STSNAGGNFNALTLGTCRRIQSLFRSGILTACTVLGNPCNLNDALELGRSSNLFAVDKREGEGALGDAWGGEGVDDPNFTVLKIDFILVDICANGISTFDFSNA